MWLRNLNRQLNMNKLNTRRHLTKHCSIPGVFCLLAWALESKQGMLVEMSKSLIKKLYS